MHSNTTDCFVCGEIIPNNDFDIKSHLLFHENEWIKTLRNKYEISLDYYDI